MRKVGIISLGCPRNLVDSEVMMGLLKSKGYELVDNIADSDIAIVNTCAFIEDAKIESINTIFDLAGLKKKKRIKYIIAAGCLAQRYKDRLKRELKEVDGFVGTGDIESIDKVISDISKRPLLVSKTPEFIYNHTDPRDLITPPHYVYIKIQEGCNNRCSYCVIPQLRGRLRSRPIESILKEIKSLSRNNNISELILIGQDTTSYGCDLYKRKRLPELLRRIARMNKTKWVRLLYTHPAHYSRELIKTIKDEENVCKYLDLPIQHISDRILKRMNRNTVSSSIKDLIGKIRKYIPGAAIRTTVLVGFPGETDADFMKLLDFMKEARFERLGAFTYSNEEGSRSFNYEHQIPEKIKKERLDEVMKLQREISEDCNRSFLNKTLDVLIDEKDAQDSNLFIGRTQFDAPSVDGQVFVRAKNIKTGRFVKVKITDTLKYDLVGQSIFAGTR